MCFQNKKRKWVLTVKKDVVISIKSIQTVDDEQDVTELLTMGNLYRRNDDYYITYEESEVTGYEGSKTTMKILGDSRVTLERSGATKSNLVIEKGKKHHCHYGTLYGDLMVGIYADKISSSLNDLGGDLYLKYTIDINSSYMSDNEIYVNVKECKSEDVTNA